MNEQVVTPSLPEGELKPCCERVDPEGKQPIFNDARIATDAKEAKAVLAMVDAVRDYGAVMDACLEEAAKLIPKKDAPPGLQVEKPEYVEASRFEARIKIALALYSKATATQQADIDKYLDKLIEWYEAKDAPGEAPDRPPFPVPPTFYPARVSPTERLADLLLDFLESRIGVIFGEVKEDRDGEVNTEA